MISDNDLYEFLDDIIYRDGHCDPMPGSDADFKYDKEEIEECEKIMCMKYCPVEILCLTSP